MRGIPGINPVALVRSAFELARFRRVTAGGSTITMQLARLRFHLQTRTVSGKLTQIVRALELERHYSKNEILEAYFNLAPYGRNIEGAGAASQIYFGKRANGLTGPEAIALSVIPQSPTRRALFTDRDNRSVASAQNGWYDRAGIDQQFSAREFNARVQTERKFLAPHFVCQVLESAHGRDEITTTLDLGRQRLIERRIADYVAANRHRGIENAAALLVDVRTMDVLAQAGSADFCKIDINGQVDGTRSVAVARFDIEAVCLRARARTGFDSAVVDPGRCAAQFRRIQSGKFRSRISRTDPRLRRARAQPQRSRG